MRTAFCGVACQLPATASFVKSKGANEGQTACDFRWCSSYHKNPQPPSTPAPDPPATLSLASHFPAAFSASRPPPILPATTSRLKESCKKRLEPDFRPSVERLYRDEELMLQDASKPYNIGA